MKHILHIMSLSRRAGLEVMFLNYLKFMKKNNPEIISYQHVLGINMSNYFRKELIRLGVNVYECKKQGKLDISPIKLANQIIKQKDIKIIYGQNFIGNTIASILSIKYRNARIVCHEHGTSWNTKGFTYFITRLWIKKSDVIICNSKAAAILLKKRFMANEGKLKIIYNGVPKRPKKNIHKEKKKLLFVGRLDIVKSPHTVIYMMSDLVKRDDSITLEVLGEGKYESELKELTKKLNLSKNIIFRGNVEDVDSYMANATLLILPSMREPLGNVTIEAAFQETPTVATKVDGIPEVIKNNETGVLIEPKEKLYNHLPVKKVVNIETEKLQRPLSPSSKELADVVYKLLMNEEKVKKMGKNACNYVTKKFSMEKYYENLTKVIK